MAYSIRQEAHQSGDVIAVTGDADVSAAAELQRAIVTSDTSTVTVDLSETTLLDSRTIAVLVDWTHALRSRGGDLVLMSPNRNVLGLLRRIGLDDQLTIVA